ncbi:ATP-binding protein [Rhodoferax sp.]|uniref:hybrid sensor histidine kinase/response regulator n=1 Tax=Rhodoferax sp. TaxID=50421 RepID=UPI00271D4C65|nr:ATP-binding protein [Rhodoferax sp.]MDO8318374.1 ATP-binding protein [Rhodoferax sp.]
MKTPDIRLRMLLAALLPVLLLSVLLSSVFLATRFEDITEAYQLRTRAVARQLALISEFGLFAANRIQLQTLVRGALREPDVRWVAILDQQGQMLASAGDVQAGALPPISTLQEQAFLDRELHDVLTQPVFATDLKLDDLYEDTRQGNAGRAAPLGLVVLKFSRQSLNAQKRDILLLGGLISALGLLFGAVLAVKLSAGVIRPMMRVSHLIERIGHGDFAAAAQVQAQTHLNDPLRDLQQNLFQMADRLANVQRDLELQVATVTHALREKKEEAEQATHAKSRFLAAASHDLRQPVHALGMFVARLAQLSHDATTRHLIDKLNDSVLAMQNLLDGLLDISRLEAKAIQIKLESLPLADLFERLALDLAPLAQDKGLRLRFRSSQVWVKSDPALLYRILLNLVGNALRYTETGGVLVACRRISGADQVAIEVWDTGMGIAPEHQEAVFKEFYQVDNPARQRSQGMGLGLNIVQRSCQLLNHPLQLVSHQGVGTRFRLTVPQAAPQAQSAVLPVADASEPLDWRHCTVLVIEDDDLVRQALVGLLESWDMTVAEASSLARANQLLGEGVRPNLLISDYCLSDAPNGIMVIAQLRQRLAYPVPSCLISGDTDPELIRAAQTAQLSLLHKPVRPAKLRNLLRHLMRAQTVPDGVDRS